MILGCHAVKFERAESSSSSSSEYGSEGEEDDHVVARLTSDNNGLRLSVNEYSCTRFEFYDHGCGDTVVSVDKDGIDMHCNKISSLDDPCSSKDAANKQYVD
jgi:hypothetical protein